MTWVDDAFETAAKQVDNNVKRLDTLRNLQSAGRQLTDDQTNELAELTTKLANMDEGILPAAKTAFENGNYTEGFDKLSKALGGDQAAFEFLITLDDTNFKRLFGVNFEKPKSATDFKKELIEDESRFDLDTQFGKMQTAIANYKQVRTPDMLRIQNDQLVKLIDTYADMPQGVRTQVFKRLPDADKMVIVQNYPSILKKINKMEFPRAFTKDFTEFVEATKKTQANAEALAKNADSLDSMAKSDPTTIEWMFKQLGVDNLKQFLIWYGGAVALAYGIVKGAQFIDDYNDKDNKKRKCNEQCLPREWALFQSGQITAEDLESPDDSEVNLFPPTRTCYTGSKVSSVTGIAGASGTCFNNEYLNEETKGRPDEYCSSAEINCTKFCKQTCGQKYKSDLGLFFDMGVDALGSAGEGIGEAVGGAAEGAGEGVGAGLEGFLEGLLGDSWMWYVGGIGAIILLVVIIMLFRK